MTDAVTLPGRIVLRRAGPDGAPVIAALVNAHAQHLVGTRRALIDAVPGAMPRVKTANDDNPASRALKAMNQKRMPSRT